MVFVVPITGAVPSTRFPGTIHVAAFATNGLTKESVLTLVPKLCLGTLSAKLCFASVNPREMTSSNSHAGLGQSQAVAATRVTRNRVSRRCVPKQSLGTTYTF